MFFRRLNWNVVGWFRTVSAISYVIIGLGIAMMIFNYVKTGAPLRLGLSFTGGTDITLRFAAPTTQSAVAAAMPLAGITDAKINSIGPKPGEPAGERWTIETQKDFGNDSTPLYAALAKIGPVYEAPDTKPPLPKLGTDGAISTVGPSLSHEYLLNAVKALVIAISIQFLYIAFRFGWNLIFGWVCVVALVRDSLMMIGIYAIAGKRVDDAFLAAVLTVIGYSVMDTIVILDRIRENVKVLDGHPFDEIVNTSILQTMTRSVNTLATVVITLVALIAFGGASLQNFAFALLVGICSGGYHSIFFSAPLVAVLQKRAKSRRIFRGSSLEQPKTVAAARAQKSAAAAQRDREEIAALRRARRERERDGGSRRPAQPPRYKRQRNEPTDFEKLENRNFGVPDRPKPPPNEPAAEEQPDGFDYEHDREIVDPLDAQTMGLHDEANALGHETITLNLGDDEHVPTPVVPAAEPKPNP
jgi:preprotein translocase SecF subunit